MPRTTVSASGPPPPPRARRTARRSRAAAARRRRRAGRRAPGRPARPGFRPRRRGRAGRRARAGRRRRAAGARRAAARARRRAAGAPAPRRARAPRRAPCSAASAGSASSRPPSMRTELIPSSRPSASTSGPPEEPRGSGAECSIEPPMRRPRGPRNERPVAVTRPNVVRRPRPPGSASANTGLPARERLDGGRIPGDGGRAAGVDLDHGDVEVGVDAGDAAEHELAVRAPHGDLVAAQHVRVGEHAPVGDHDARAAAPAATEPDHRRARPARRRRSPPPAARRGSRPSVVLLQSHLLLASHYAYQRAGLACRAMRRRHGARRPRWPTRSPASATAGRCSSSPRCSRARSASTSCRRSSTGSRPTCSADG